MDAVVKERKKTKVSAGVEKKLPTRIKKVGIIGAGQMGNGIAHVVALAGYDVALNDLKKEAVENAVKLIEKNMGRQVTKGMISEDDQGDALKRISYAPDYKAFGDCDLVIEAATEDESVKRRIFMDLCPDLKKDAILATNTSSISITRLASTTDRPEHFIGMHFMNPVPVMKLVEVINGYATAAEVTEQILAVSRRLGKAPVAVNDYPGFVANRILMPMINEAVIALFEGVAGVEEIDEVMKLGMAHPMGPLQLADFIGLDVCLSILRVLHDGFGQPKYAPCPLLVNMVTAGKLGVKTGEGFYQYTNNGKDRVVAANFSPNRF